MTKMCETCKKRESAKIQIIIGKDLCLSCYKRYVKIQVDIVEKLAENFKGFGEPLH